MSLMVPSDVVSNNDVASNGMLSDDPVSQSPNSDNSVVSNGFRFDNMETSDEASVSDDPSVVFVHMALLS